MSPSSSSTSTARATTPKAADCLGGRCSDRPPAARHRSARRSVFRDGFAARLSYAHKLSGAAVAGQAGPADLRSTTLLSPENATYAPDEFVAPNGHAIEGVDPDLLRALAKVIDVKVAFTNVPFDEIIPGLVSGQYQISASSIDDTKSVRSRSGSSTKRAPGRRSSRRETAVSCSRTLATCAAGLLRWSTARQN